MTSEACENFTEYEGAFHFDPEDPVYETHFPQCPVVPGSLMIHAFLQALQENGIACDGLEIENFSFREFLPPGACRFYIAGRGGKLECRIMKDGEKIASGILRYGT